MIWNVRTTFGLPGFSVGKTLRIPQFSVSLLREFWINQTHIPTSRKTMCPKKKGDKNSKWKHPQKEEFVYCIYIYVNVYMYIYIYICMHSFRIIINFVQACGIIYDNSGYSMIFLERRCGPVRFEKNNNNLPSRSLTANAPEKLPKPNRKGSSSSPTIFQG